MKNKIRAYKVSWEFEGLSCIVFSTSHNKAKTIGMGYESFDGLEYTELNCCLAPGFEILNDNTEYIVDFCANSELFHKNNWNCYASDYNECHKKECNFIKDRDNS